MALDGFTISALRAELNNTILQARIYKISQPEADEILLTLKTEQGQNRLLLCADATLPFLYLTEQNKPSPMSAPNFCMLLRKHLQNGRIVAIRQPSLERILMFDIEHLDEMGDLKKKTLIVEIMGKHSNIIFTDEDGTIIDSIKHISAAVSSVREVLPGRPYFIPQTTDKFDPFTVTKEEFIPAFLSQPLPAGKAVYTLLTGFSPLMSEELLYRSSLDSDRSANTLEEDHVLHLYGRLREMMEDVTAGDFDANIIYRDEEPVAFAALPLTMYAGETCVHSPSVSSVLQEFYQKKNAFTRIRQKSADLRRIVQTALERNVRKYDLQLKQLKDTAKKDKYKLYGELLNTYGYSCEPGAKTFTCENYYNGEQVTIPLDDTLSALENAQKFFDRYQKLKRTEEALLTQSAQTKGEIDHLSSVMASLDIAQKEEDLLQITDELADTGYIRRKSTAKRAKITSKPFHYISSDGFDMYVGKNNYQNDELTFRLATGNDWWFHAKGIPGSHVIVKSENKELPDRTFEEAAALAAYYSTGRESGKVEVDYVRKKEVKKPGGAAPGFVVYYTNFSMVAVPKIGHLQQAD
ncbi:MAG: NFACT family protein [Lachnospiraceae bacterium]|nr:NFACT family protein [Lachnospiraceae bacterium]